MISATCRTRGHVDMHHLTRHKWVRERAGKQEKGRRCFFPSVDTRKVPFFCPSAWHLCEGRQLLIKYINDISESWQFIQEERCIFPLELPFFLSSLSREVASGVFTLLL